MKSDYWNVNDEQVVEKTGKKIDHWLRVIDKVAPTAESSNDIVGHLVKEHGVPRYWARTLTTLHKKRRGE